MQALLRTDDIVLPFQLEKTTYRGRIVRLGAALDIILKQHDYPLEVAQLLAETVCLASALASSLKFEGVFTLQTKSDGAVRLLVADVTSEGAVRAVAHFDKDKLKLARETKSALVGKGHLAFTVDRGGSAEDRYQGIVALESDDLAAAVQTYFKKSEQLATGVVVGARKSEAGWRGGCLLVQPMPREGGHEVVFESNEEEDWQRTMLLMKSCTVAELSDPALTADELLFRLFHEEEVRVFDAKPMEHRCRCSKERVEAMLKSIDRQEVEALAVEGKVSVTCEFCNRSYDFDKEAVDGLYLPK